METSTIILIVVIIIIISYFFFFSKSTERMSVTANNHNHANATQENILEMGQENNQEEMRGIGQVIQQETDQKNMIDPNIIKMKLATNIFNNFSDQMSYVDYLKMLTQINNISNNLIKREVFATLRSLRKSNNLTGENIINLMTDI